MDTDKNKEAITDEMLEKVLEEARTRLEAAIEKLTDLGSNFDAIRLFFSVCPELLLHPADMMEESNYGDSTSKIELLAYYLFPLIGVSDNKRITPWHSKEVHEALNELHRSRMQIMMFSKTENELPAKVGYLKKSLRMYAEIVRGSAYPEQTGEELIAIQGKFENIFNQKAGIGPIRANKILWAIIKKQESSYNGSKGDIQHHGKLMSESWLAIKEKDPDLRTEKEAELFQWFKDEKNAYVFGCVQRSNEIATDILTVGPEDLDTLENKPTEKEWNSLIDLIGLTQEVRQQMTETIEVQQRPLFVFPDSRLFLADISNAFDVLYDRFEKIAKSERRFYDSRYQRKKAKWLEGKVSEYLKRIFPPNHVFQNLSYPDPDKEDGSTTELDAAVHWGPFLVLVEAKAKQFRLESQLGDVGRLVTDIKANVEDAFEQARRATRYIDKTENPEFTVTSTGEKIVLNRANLFRIYLITVSQHHLAEIATRLADMQDFGLFKDNQYPLSLCVADLDTISQFCEGPDVFLHYVERRLDIQSGSVELISPELGTFGAYLDTRLHPEKVFEQDGDPINAINLGGFQDRFDKWMHYNRGDLDEPPDIRLRLPDQISSILQELRRRTEDDGARLLAFSLLGMSEIGLESLNQNIKMMREAEIQTGMFKRVTFQEKDTVYTVIASKGLPRQLLYERTYIRAQLEKYRRKALRSVCIGIRQNDHTKPFESMFWEEGPWIYEEEMERAIKADTRSVPDPGQKLPGRNEKCICGSGKKYKKCCLPQFEAARSKSR